MEVVSVGGENSSTIAQRSTSVYDILVSILNEASTCRENLIGTEGEFFSLISTEIYFFIIVGDEIIGSNSIDEGLFESSSI